MNLSKENSGIYSNIFKNHYNKAVNIISNNDFEKRSILELLPAMFVVSDYAAANAEKDRESIANEIMTIISYLNEAYDSKAFDKRCNLYGDVIRGKEMRYDWFLGDISSLDDNAIWKCAAVLCDILFNPPCADAYDTAPVMLRGIDDSICFTNMVAIPLYKEFITLFNDIYDA